VNVVMNLQVPQNAGNVACFLPGRAKDLSAPLYLCTYANVSDFPQYVFYIVCSPSALHSGYLC